MLCMFKKKRFLSSVLENSVYRSCIFGSIVFVMMHKNTLIQFYLAISFWAL